MTTTLYRAYSPDDTLLYVGISGRLAAREAQHRSTSPWCTPDVRFVAGETFTERKDALVAERAAIRAEHPVHNVDGAPGYLRAPDYDAEVARVLAQAPQLGPDTRDRLAALLRPGAEVALPVGSDLAGEQPAPARTGEVAA